jgi:hypothetical protein
LIVVKDYNTVEVKSINNSNNIIFYDDNARYIKEAKKVWVEKANPNKSIKFIKV